MSDADAKRWEDRDHHTAVVTDLRCDFLYGRWTSRSIPSFDMPQLLSSPACWDATGRRR